MRRHSIRTDVPDFDQGSYRLVLWCKVRFSLRVLKVTRDTTARSSARGGGGVAEPRGPRHPMCVLVPHARDLTVVDVFVIVEQDCRRRKKKEEIKNLVLDTGTRY